MLHRSTSRPKLSPCERMVREWLLFNATKAIFQLYYDENKLHFDGVLFVLVQQAELDFYSVSLVKQQYTGRHVAPLRHIVLIPSQPVIAHTPYWCVLSREATNTILTSLVWPDRGSNIWSTTLDANMLIITPLMSCHEYNFGYFCSIIRLSQHIEISI